jgi:hypothetical protein
MRGEKRKQFFVKIPDELLWDGRITNMDFRVYSAFRDYADWKTAERCFPAQETIAKELGCTRETVNRSAGMLKKYGYLVWRRVKGSSNRYEFPLEKRWSKSQPNNMAITSNVTKESHYRDTSKHKQNRGTPDRLYFDKDICSVMKDGLIRIKAHHGGWLDYGGSEDDKFRFGDLVGAEAKKTAIMKYASNR